jgi:hypothetical protein
MRNPPSFRTISATAPARLSARARCVGFPGETARWREAAPCGDRRKRSHHDPPATRRDVLGLSDQRIRVTQDALDGWQVAASSGQSHGASAASKSLAPMDFEPGDSRAWARDAWRAIAARETAVSRDRRKRAAAERRHTWDPSRFYCPIRSPTLRGSVPRLRYGISLKPSIDRSAAG